MENITLDYTNVTNVITDEALWQLQPEIEHAFQMTLQFTHQKESIHGFHSA